MPTFVVLMVRGKSLLILDCIPYDPRKIFLKCPHSRKKATKTYAWKIHKNTFLVLKSFKDFILKNQEIAS